MVANGHKCQCLPRASNCFPPTRGQDKWLAAVKASALCVLACKIGALREEERSLGLAERSGLYYSNDPNSVELVKKFAKSNTELDLKPSLSSETLIPAPPGHLEYTPQFDLSAPSLAFKLPRSNSPYFSERSDILHWNGLGCLIDRVKLQVYQDTWRENVHSRSAVLVIQVWHYWVARSVGGKRDVEGGEQKTEIHPDYCICKMFTRTHPDERICQ